MNKYNILERTWYLNDLNYSIILYLKNKDSKNIKETKEIKKTILQLNEFIMTSNTCMK